MEPMVRLRPHVSDDQSPLIDAPIDLVQRYLDLAAQKRRLEDQMAYLRAELEMAASSALTPEAPRGRFVAPNGQLVARLFPTASFDRADVAQALQRLGRLAEVATLGGPSLARLLRSDPVLAARLGGLVRLRHGVMLVPGALA